MFRNIIKKIGKLITYLLLLAIILPAIALGLIQLPAVQDYAVSKTVTWLNNELGADIQYSKFRINSFNKFRIQDLYIADNNGDTLVYSSEAVAITPAVFSFLINRNTVKPIIKRLEVKGADINMKIDSSGIVNFQYLLDYAESRSKKDSSSKPILIKEILISNSSYQLFIESSVKDSTGINFGNLQLNNLYGTVKNLTIRDDTVKMNISDLQFREQSGFILDNLSGDFEICPIHMLFSDTRVITPYSNLLMERVKLGYTSYGDFNKDSLFNKVKLDVRLKQSILNAHDLGFFADVFRGTKQSVNLAGNIYGPISNLKGRQFLIGWGSTSFLAGKFNINGLPDPEETFLIFDLSELVTNTDDITGIDLPGKKRLKLPEQLSNLENLKYKGNFTGFLNDFVSNGKLVTNLGSVYTDLMFTPDSLNQIRLSGRISTNGFSIGKLIGNEDLVKDVSMDATVTGYYSKDKPLTADINGNIYKLTLKDYPYENIKINGTLSDKRFSGELNVDDPNLIMSFRGLIDMASEIREYDFSVNIIDANLYALNISDSDPEYHASFLLDAKAKGPNLDELNGEFNLLNSLFSKTSKQIQVYDFNLFIDNSENSNQLIVRSDIMDAKITGKYKFSELKDVFMNYMNQYLPALFEAPETSIDQLADTRFDFDFRFKQTKSFFDFFFPDYLVGEYSVARGTFAPNSHKSLTMTLFSPFLKYKNNAWKGFVLNVDSKDSLLNASVGSQNFNLNEQIDLENFTVESSIYSDAMMFSTRWLNWDSTLNKGAISGAAYFAREGDKHSFNFDFSPTSITISDTVWNLNHFTLLVDTTGIGIDGLRISKEDEFFTANGKISDLPGDTLHFSFDNFNLANMNFFLQKNDLELSGELNGKGNITGKSINPLFFSALTISDFIVNKEPLGECSINSLWNNRKQSLTINARARRGKLTMLQIDGDYYPADNGKMDFQIKLNKLKTNIINPFMKGVFSDFRGYASGDLQFSGFRGKPSLAGKLLLQKNAFTIDYLKTRYNFTTEIEIANNNIILNNIQVFDREGNFAVVNGVVRTEYLKDIDLNLGITMHNLLCMDTKESDNEMFFGTAYASGNIKIKGKPNNLSFDINAETEKNTRLFIPLSQEGEVSNYDFVTFIRQDSSEIELVAKEDVQRVNLSGMQMNFNLDITPDAELQIIFDPKMGDIIKSRGSGRLRLSINTLGSFDMVGQYTIEKGDYLFTLSNVINKRLKIDPGSTLRWSGDPLNANIDVTAIYRTKAMLSDLLVNTDPNQDPGNVTVDCRIFLSDLLMSPSIKYDLFLPFSEESVRTTVESKIQSEEELSKQFISLLVMNRFMPSSTADNQSTGDTYLAGVNNASELLSNQLSNWLSQISNDFDVGVNYRPGGELTSSEVEVMLSTQFFNDRLSIDGSLDMKSKVAAQNTSNFSGDFDADYKLNKKGKIRLRAFNHSNDNIANNDSDYTQGFGIFFKEEFSSLGDLRRRYWKALRGKRKKNKTKEADIKHD